jgi:hypothetical protein
MIAMSPAEGQKNTRKCGMMLYFYAKFNVISEAEFAPEDKCLASQALRAIIGLVYLTPLHPHHEPFDRVIEDNYTHQRQIQCPDKWRQYAFSFHRLAWVSKLLLAHYSPNEERLLTHKGHSSCTYVPLIDRLLK